MGGVAIAAATLTAFAVVAGVQPALIDAPQQWLPVLLAAMAMFLVGIFDDRLQLSPVAKLVFSLAIGAFLVFALAGIEPEGALPSWYTLVATVWFAGVCHSVNLLDNMDGLASGVGLIAALFLAALLGGGSAPVLGLTIVALLTALAGALLGFFHWNRTPARPTAVESLPFAFDGPPAPAPPDVVARDGSGRVTIRAVRLTSPIRLDGQLDEAIYAAVRPISDFVQQEPQEGSPATEKTEAWLLFDDDRVYASFRCVRSAHP